MVKQLIADDLKRFNEMILESKSKRKGFIVLNTNFGLMAFELNEEKLLDLIKQEMETDTDSYVVKPPEIAPIEYDPLHFTCCGTQWK